MLIKLCTFTKFLFETIYYLLYLVFIFVCIDLYITFSLYAEPKSWTDLKSTPFIPFLPSLERRLRKHRRIQQKQIPNTTTPTPIQKVRTLVQARYHFLIFILWTLYLITYKYYVWIYKFTNLQE